MRKSIIVIGVFAAVAFTSVTLWSRGGEFVEWRMSDDGVQNRVAQIEQLLTQMQASSAKLPADDNVRQRIGQIETQLKGMQASQTRIASQDSPASPASAGSARPPLLPSIVLSEEEAKQRDMGFYRGRIDKAHLGGFVELDVDGMSPNLWRMMMRNWTLHSIVDVGCGRGISSSWFMDKGAEVLCVEGSHEAHLQSYLPAENRVEHDFSRGPWWPTERTYDFVWSIEFLEHVSMHYMKNYLPIFHRAAYLIVSHSLWGGHHHVEVHGKEWWMRRLLAEGFVFDKALTEQAHAAASSGRQEGFRFHNKKVIFNAQHLWTTLLVFVNPAVAGLPQHDHLFSEPGCEGPHRVRILEGMVECEDGDRKPGSYMALPGSFKNDADWYKLLNKSTA